MRIYKWFDDFFEKIISLLWYMFIWIHEMKNIYQKRNIYKGIKLTKDQKQQIDKFWEKNYGRKIPYLWHRLYQSYTGKFDVNYFPEYIFSLKLEPRYNNMKYANVISDKNLLEIVFNDSLVKIPRTIVALCGGVWLDKNRSVISQDRAIENLKNIGEVIIKITVESSSGRGVKLCNFKNGIDEITNKPIESIIKEMGDNIVVQEKLVAHKDYAKLHESSINTIRVVSYILNGEIHVGPLTMRIGSGGNFVDNAHAGGMFIGVSEEGELYDEAYTEYQKRYTVHPDSGIQFKGYRVPYIKEMIEAAKRLHGKVPMLKFVSWDFMIDNNNKIVLVEANLMSQTIWFPQMANGKGFFGENTEEMIKLARKK